MLFFKEKNSTSPIDARAEERGWRCCRKFGDVPNLHLSMVLYEALRCAESLEHIVIRIQGRCWIRTRYGCGAGGCRNMTIPHRLAQGWAGLGCREWQSQQRLAHGSYRPSQNPLCGSITRETKRAQTNEKLTKKSKDDQ